MINKRLIEKVRHKGSVLVLTLLIVTLMASAALSAAVSSYSIIGNASSYNDADVAKQAAMAGVADLTSRLKTTSYKADPKTVLVNFDKSTGDSGKEIVNPSTNEKKAPYIKYYSFTPQEKIKTISRCTKVAVVNAYDYATSNYIGPNDIFTTLGNSMDKSNILRNNGFKAFNNPLTPKNAVDGSNKYDPSDVNYWSVYMGGPLDQGTIQANGTSWTNNKDGNSMYQGLFSVKDYLQYDLIIMSLPDWGFLTLDDKSRENLEDWIRAGGKLMIDSMGQTLGINNGPFSDDVDGDEDANFKFQWDAVEKNTTDTTKPTTGSFYSLSGMNNDTWVMKNAYNNYYGEVGNPTDLQWEKKSPTVTTAQSITGAYRVRELYKDYPVTTTYPPSSVSYDGDGSKSLDTAFIESGKLYIKYGMASQYGLGERISIMTINRKYNDLTFPSYEYYKNYYYYNTTVTGKILSIDLTENSITFDTNSFMCYTPNHKNDVANGNIGEGDGRFYDCDSNSSIDSFFTRWNTNDYTLNWPYKDGEYQNFGNMPQIYHLTDDDDYFTKKSVSSDCYGYDASNDYTTMTNNDTSSKFDCVWGTGTATVNPVPGDNNSIFVDDIGGYTVGSIVQIEPSTEGGFEPVWGKVTGIDYIAKTLTVDMKTGPTPRANHGLVTDENTKKVYLFGGSDISNRFANGHLDSQASTSLSDGTSSIKLNIANYVRNDLWVYNMVANTWELITPTNTLDTRPFPRSSALVTYDSNSNKLIVVGGSTGGYDDSAVTQVGRLADVWKINVDVNPAWSQVIDREIINQNSIEIGTYKSEVYARPSFRNDYYTGKYSWTYWVEPVLTSGDITSVILHTNTNTNSYPSGITVGDTVKINSYDDTTSSTPDTDIVNLTGTISRITKDLVDLTKYTLYFDTPMVGAHTDPRLDRGLQISIVSYCNTVTTGQPQFGGVGTCTSPGQTVMYYGGNNVQVGNRDDYKDRMYWGKIAAVNQNTTTKLTEKSFTQLYNGPFFMYNPGGYYDAVVDKLYVSGGYGFGGSGYAANKEALWVLENALNGNLTNRTWRLVNPKAVSDKDYKVFQDKYIPYDYSYSYNNFTSPRAVFQNTTAGDNGSITSGDVTSLKLKSGEASNIAIGARYYVYPVDVLHASGKLWGVVKDIRKDGLFTWVDFNDPLKIEDMPVDYPGSNIVPNDGAPPVNGVYLRNDSSYRIDQSSNPILGSFDVVNSMTTSFDISGTPSTIQINADQTIGMYIGKTLTMQSYSGNTGEHKLMSAVVSDLDYEAATDMYTVSFRYMSSFGQWTNYGNLSLIHNGSTLYKATSDNGNMRLWSGVIDTVSTSSNYNTVEWKYIDTDNAVKRPSYRYSGTLYYDSSTNKIGLWGGDSNFNYLWKINPTVASPAWDEPIKNNPDDVIGTDRPFGLGYVTGTQSGDNLVYFSGYYTLAYPKEDRNYDTKITDLELSPGASENVWSGSTGTDIVSTDKSTVQFKHTLLSSLYDRYPLIQGNDIFAMDKTNQQDVLKLGYSGYALTDLGPKFDVIATFPCDTSYQPPAVGKNMILPWNEDTMQIVPDKKDPKDGTTHKVCKSANMAMASIGDNGGYLFLSSRALSLYYSMADQIDKLDIMNYAFQQQKTDTSRKNVYTNYSDDNYNTGLVSDWKDWLNMLASWADPVKYYNGAVASPIDIKSTGGDVAIDLPASAFYKYWDEQFHYYRWYDDTDKTYYYYHNINGEWKKLKNSEIGATDANRYIMYKEPKDLAYNFLYTYKPGTFDVMRNAVFYINMIAYSQALDKVKVTGYYGGVARAFLVSYLPSSGSILSVEEVPAEE